MLYNYLKTAWRNILKRRSISFLNAFSLALGITACILILQYVKFEKSFDDFHPDLSQLYRLNLGMTSVGESELIYRATNHPAAGIYLMQDFPVVEAFSRLVDMSIFSGSSVLSSETKAGTKSFYEEHVYVADSSFLTMFGFELVSGDRGSALQNPEHLVITESLAKRYFGNEDPMGKIMKLNDGAPFVVSGILKDPPANTHFEISALFSASGFSEGLNNAWIWPEFHTYIKVSPDADISQLSSQLDPFVDRYLGDVMRDFGIEEKMVLQPVRDIHLDGNLLKEVKENGQQSKIVFMILIALMIIVVAWINYINLSTSRSIERSTEVGVRKVVGASRANIMHQFLIEAALMNFLAIALSIAIVLVLVPYFDYLVDAEIIGNSSLWDIFRDKMTLLMLVVLFFAGIIFTGIYPAMVLSSFKPQNTIKGSIFTLNHQIDFRQVLVVFQFAIGILMIAGTLIVIKQVSFMRSHDMGFNKDQLLMVKAPSIVDSTLDGKMNLLKEQMLQQPTISHFAASSDIPGHLIQNNNSVRRKEQTQEESFFATYLAIDEDYIPAYEIELLAGRNFVKDRELDRNAVIVNSRTARLLGYPTIDDVVGKIITYKDDQQWKDGEVLGVVRDFNHRSLAYEQEPFVLFNRPLIAYDYYALKIEAKGVANTVDIVEHTYSEIFPKNPFDYFFLDDYFDKQYRADQRFGWIFGLFACLAIIVACIGLIGLAAHIAANKAKEAGMRKILGASPMQILILFGKRFIWLVLIAAIFALPVAWWGGTTWMQNYAYQTNLPFWVFLIPVTVVLILSALTMIWQYAKMAWVNPAEVLKE